MSTTDHVPTPPREGDAASGPDDDSGVEAARDVPRSSVRNGAPVRASNDERTEVVEALHHALGEGRLDLAETEDRVASAYAAQYRYELLPLLADLPGAAAPSTLLTGTAPPWVELWRALVWRVRLLVLRDGAAAAPTARQCRTAAFVATAAAVWFLLCMLVGALAVGA